MTQKLNKNGWLLWGRSPGLRRASTPATGARNRSSAGPGGPAQTWTSAPRQAGFSLVELIVAFSILLILTSMAVPMARYQVRRGREKELREDLRDMRAAIDRYKDYCDSGKLQATSPEAYCYPVTLQALVDGVPMSNTISGLNQTGKMRFLRRIPKDPMTGDTDWGKRAMQDEPTSNSWGGQNVFDVYTKTTDRASDGTPYSEW